jgi:hypothetical protein
VTLDGVIATLTKAREDFTRLLAEADPDRVTTAQAAQIVTLYAELERLVVAGKLLFETRAEHGVHRLDPAPHPGSR